MAPLLAGALGWGTVIVDWWDPSTTTSINISCDVNYSLAAAWLGRVEVAHPDLVLKTPQTLGARPNCSLWNAALCLKMRGIRYASVIHGWLRTCLRVQPLLPMPTS